MTELSLRYVKYKDRDPQRYGKLVIESLEPRSGLSYGNALRRVLLSSIPGKGIVAVRIDGVVHEFSTLPGVRDDTSEIIQNLKKIVWKGDNTTAVQTATFELKGPATVTAGDIQLPMGLSVVNKDLYITTVADGVAFRLEMDVVSGKGWISCEKNKSLEADIRTIFIDTNYNPIDFVGYSIQEINSDGIHGDRLTMEIETDGSIAPDQAVCLSAKILKLHMHLLTEIKVGAPELPQQKDSEADNTSHLLADISDLNLSARSKNCLKYTDIKTIGDLVTKSVQDLIEIKNFGKKSLNEIRDKLSVLKLTLKGDEGWADASDEEGSSEDAGLNKEE